MDVLCCWKFMVVTVWFSNWLFYLIMFGQRVNEMDRQEFVKILTWKTYFKIWFQLQFQLHEQATYNVSSFFCAEKRH